jgi:hypothetical protein
MFIAPHDFLHYRPRKSSDIASTRCHFLAMGLIVFALGLFVPSLHLFDVIRSHENVQRLYVGRTDIPGATPEAQRVARILRHIVVLVAFQAIAPVLDFLLGWLFPFSIIEILIVVWLVGLIPRWCYSGSHEVFETVLRQLALKCPFIVSYAEDEYKRSTDRAAVVHKLWSIVLVQYDTIYRQITDD